MYVYVCNAPDPGAARAAHTGDAARLTHNAAALNRSAAPAPLPGPHAGEPTIRTISPFLDTGLLSILE